ncbi:DUF4129 domain-containing protein, partial [Jatrophihabitans sp. YIM 134969]
EGGAAVPDAAGPLGGAARVFDETWFGARPATSADVETARAGLEAVRRTRASSERP